MKDWILRFLTANHHALEFRIGLWTYQYVAVCHRHLHAWRFNLASLKMGCWSSLCACGGGDEKKAADVKGMTGMTSKFEAVKRHWAVG